MAGFRRSARAAADSFIYVSACVGGLRIQRFGCASQNERKNSAIGFFVVALQHDLIITGAADTAQ